MKKKDFPLLDMEGVKWSGWTNCIDGSHCLSGTRDRICGRWICIVITTEEKRFVK